MFTFNDLEEVKSDEEKAEFVLNCIGEHIDSDEYQIACDADLYYKQLNPSIMNAQKLIYNAMGQAVPDIYSANNKIPSNYFFFFVTQLTQYLLANGVSFDNQDVKEKLGANFDTQLAKLSDMAQKGGVAFGFWNEDHLEVFPLASETGKGTSFKPLYDEEDGALKAGVRFWRLDADSPMRATLFELDGYTEYIENKDEKLEIKQAKRAYKVTRKSWPGLPVDDMIFDRGNYPYFPIVPLWNVNRQSALVGMRETIDAYDLMLSDLINNVSDAEIIYWVLKNCNGMSPEDDERFIEQLKMTHVVHADGDDGANAEAHSVNVPYDASQTSLALLRQQLFDGFMGFDAERISAGNTTATEIRAAYQKLDSKADNYEFNVIDFVQGILRVAGLEDEKFHFTRSKIINVSEEVTTVVHALTLIDEETATRKVCELLGMTDEIEDILQRKQAEMIQRAGLTMQMQGETTAEEDEE